MIRQTSSFTYTMEGDSMEVTLHGDIDHHSAVGLRTGLDRLLYEKRPGKLWLNLSRVEFMDSSGLGFILGRYNLMRELGGELCLCAPGERVERILHLAGVERLVPILPAMPDKPLQSDRPLQSDKPLQPKNPAGTK